MTAIVCRTCGSEVAISHPGDVHLDERQTGYCFAMAIAWRAIQHARTADDCRRAVAELGTKPPPDLTGAPRP